MPNSQLQKNCNVLHKTQRPKHIFQREIPIALWANINFKTS